MAHELIWEHMFLGTELPVLEPGSALPQGSEPGDWKDAEIWVNPGGQAVLRWDYVSTHDVSNVRSMLYIHRRTGNFMMVRGFPNVPVILTVRKRCVRPPFQPSDLQPKAGSRTLAKSQGRSTELCGPCACGTSLFHRISCSSLLRAQ